MNQEMIEQVAARLDNAAARLMRQTREGDTRNDLSPSRLGALTVACERGPISLAALAVAERVSAPTMSRIVDGLVREGLLQREQDARDRRIVRITITDDGRAALRHGRRGQVAAISARVRRLGDSEKRALLRGVELIERLMRN